MSQQSSLAEQPKYTSFIRETAFSHQDSPPTAVLTKAEFSKGYPHATSGFRVDAQSWRILSAQGEASIITVYVLREGAQDSWHENPLLISSAWHGPFGKPEELSLLQTVWLESRKGSKVVIASRGTTFQRKHAFTEGAGMLSRIHYDDGDQGGSSGGRLSKLSGAAWRARGNWPEDFTCRAFVEGTSASHVKALHCTMGKFLSEMVEAEEARGRGETHFSI